MPALRGNCNGLGDERIDVQPTEFRDDQVRICRRFELDGNVSSSRATSACSMRQRIDGDLGKVFWRSIRQAIEVGHRIVTAKAYRQFRQVVLKALRESALLGLY